MLAIGTARMPARTADGSQPDLQRLSHSMYASPTDAVACRARTAADIAYAAYGDLVKIDSALCKKLASEAALRKPVQRRADQKLNIERRSNVEALLAHMTGQPAAHPCKNCRKGHGPWSQCIVYEGQMCGSCTNCWFNASGSRCTFHENNHPMPQALYTNSSAAASGATILASLSQGPPPPPPRPPHPPAPTNPRSLSVDRLITQTITDVATFSKRERFLARIEAAAKELGMRIAEYEEYLETPEGVAEQNAAVDRERAQTTYSQAAEVSMVDAPWDGRLK
ncbi:hypothetical protein BBK36DRAFT_1167159 [Trichoderma citrinoviride]|uniref:Uncharacterized protein n=1 Tax=Trichoderma citrinoviride TaxID=58853 RepID=A0A2T4BF37_9HYPO|nr:hypothetical protein BBK36DRAFT_1167159 [Trichoderma citrinoviride]PTB67861.1 hypothetical protein BBK36DRAFT_1167159 [Trichoderma citrinoviride]